MLKMGKLIIEQAGPPVSLNQNTISGSPGAKTPARGSAQGGQTGGTTRPAELGSTQQVQQFQNWLDKAHPGWVGGSGVLNQGSGYGNFGPKTTAAWGRYGAEYMKSANNPPQQTQQKADPQAWFKDKEAKGFFTGGKVVSIRSGELAYMKHDPSDKSYYYFFGDKYKFEDGNLLWVQYTENANGDYVETDRGGYKFPEFSVDNPNAKDVKSYQFNPEKGKPRSTITDLTAESVNIMEQIIVSRRSKGGPSRPEERQQVQQDQNEELMRIYRTFIGSYWGIPDSRAYRKPDPALIATIAGAISEAIRKGYQATAFNQFKQGVEALQKLYPNDYNTVNLSGITATTEGLRFQNYPIRDADNRVYLNQLEDPRSQIDAFRKVPMRQLISALPQSAPGGLSAYIWQGFIGSGDQEPMGINISNLENDTCMNALMGWYNVYGTKTPVGTEDAKRIKNFLVTCESKCFYTNKDERPINRITKKQAETTAGKMVMDLSSTNAGIWRVPFDRNIDQRCKQMGKYNRSMQKGLGNATGRTQTTGGIKTIGQNESVEFSANKMIREALLKKASEKKQPLREQKFISARLGVIREEFERTNDHDKLFDDLFMAGGMFQGVNINEAVLNENWMDFLGSIFGGSIFGGSISDVVQEKFAGWIASSIFGDQDTSYLKNFIVTGAGALDLNNISKILSGDCRALSKWLSEAIFGTIIRTRNARKSATGQAGVIQDFIRNTVEEVLFKDKSETVQLLEDKILSYVCPKVTALKDKFAALTGKMKQGLIAST